MRRIETALWAAADVLVELAKRAFVVALVVGALLLVFGASR